MSPAHANPFGVGTPVIWASPAPARSFPRIGAKRAMGFALYALLTVLSGKGRELIDLTLANMRHCCDPISILVTTWPSEVAMGDLSDLVCRWRVRG